MRFSMSSVSMECKGLISDSTGRVAEIVCMFIVFQSNGLEKPAGKARRRPERVPGWRKRPFSRLRTQERVPLYYTARGKGLGRPRVSVDPIRIASLHAEGRSVRAMAG